MVLVDLHLHGAQSVLVGKELSLLRPESLGSETGAVTEIGRNMVRRDSQRAHFGPCVWRDFPRRNLFEGFLTRRFRGRSSPIGSKL